MENGVPYFQGPKISNKSALQRLLCIKTIRRTEKLIFVCVSPSYIQVYSAVEPTLSNAEVCFWIAFFWKRVWHIMR